MLEKVQRSRRRLSASGTNDKMWSATRHPFMLRTLERTGLPRNKDATRNKCHATSNRCLTSSNKKLVETSASLLVTSALLVVTMFAIRNNKLLACTRLRHTSSMARWHRWQSDRHETSRTCCSQSQENIHVRSHDRNIMIQLPDSFVVQVLEQIVIIQGFQVFWNLARRRY